MRQQLLSRAPATLLGDMSIAVALVVLATCTQVAVCDERPPLQLVHVRDLADSVGDQSVWQGAQPKDFVCADGSPAIAYIRDPPGDAPNLGVVVYLGGGGGMCDSKAACDGLLEAQPRRMSSSAWRYPPTLAGDDLLSQDAQQNPAFAGYGHVYVPHCSADWFLGDDVSGPDADGYTRSGALIARAALAYALVAMRADTLVVAGTGVGGVGALNHVAWARELADEIETAGSEILVSLLADSALLTDFNGALAQAPGIGAVGTAFGVGAWHTPCTHISNATLDDSVTYIKLTESTSTERVGTKTVERTVVHEIEALSPGTPCCLVASCLVPLYLPDTVPLMFIDSQFDLVEATGAYWPARNAEGRPDTNGQTDIVSIDDREQATIRLGGMREEHKNDANTAASILAALSRVSEARVGALQSFSSLPQVSWATLGCYQRGYLTQRDSEETAPSFGPVLGVVALGLHHAAGPGLPLSVSVGLPSSRFSWAGNGAGELAAAGSQPLVRLIDAWARGVEALPDHTDAYPLPLRLADGCVFPQCNPSCPAKPMDKSGGQPPTGPSAMGKLAPWMVISGILFLCCAAHAFAILQHIRFRRHCRAGETDVNRPLRPAGGSESAADGSARTADVLNGRHDNSTPELGSGGFTASSVTQRLKEFPSDSDGSTEVPPISIACVALSVSVGERNGAQKTILHDVWAYFNPFEMCAIMGPAGCGKTTLLGALANRMKGGPSGVRNRTVGGCVMLNGMPLSDAATAKLLVPHIAYVEQFESAVVPQLSVRENLLYAAQLRLPSLSWSQRAGRVRTVLEMVGLAHRADVVVGEEGRTSGLSGGQKRLLAVAISLLHSPSCLLLDEPTTGLDSTSTTRLMARLRRLASQGIAIVLTVHSPRIEVFNSFDKLLVLARGGRVAYFDEPSKVTQFVLPFVNFEPEGLESIGSATEFAQAETVKTVAERNPADLVLDAVTRRGEAMAVVFASSPEYRVMQATLLAARKALPAAGDELTRLVAYYKKHTIARESSTSVRGLFRSVWATESRDLTRDGLMTSLSTVLGGAASGVVSAVTTAGTRSLIVILFGVWLSSTAPMLLGRNVAYSRVRVGGRVVQIDVQDGAITEVARMLHLVVGVVSNTVVASILAYTPLYLTALSHGHLSFSLWARSCLAIAASASTIAILECVIQVSSRWSAMVNMLSRMLSGAFSTMSGFALPNNGTSGYGATWSWVTRWMFYVNPVYYAFTLASIFTIRSAEFECGSFKSPALCDVPHMEILRYFALDDVCEECFILVLAGLLFLMVLASVGVSLVRHRRQRQRGTTAMQLTGRSLGTGHMFGGDTSTAVPVPLASPGKRPRPAPMPSAGKRPRLTINMSALAVESNGSIGVDSNSPSSIKHTQVPSANSIESPRPRLFLPVSGWDEQRSPRTQPPAAIGGSGGPGSSSGGDPVGVGSSTHLSFSARQGKSTLRDRIDSFRHKPPTPADGAATTSLMRDSSMASNTSTSSVGRVGKLLATVGASKRLRQVKKMFVYTSKGAAREVFEDVFFACCALRVFFQLWVAAYRKRRDGEDPRASVRRVAREPSAVETDLPTEVIRFIVTEAQRILKRTSKKSAGHISRQIRFFPAGKEDGSTPGRSGGKSWHDERRRHRTGNAALRPPKQRRQRSWGTPATGKPGDDGAGVDTAGAGAASGLAHTVLSRGDSESTIGSQFTASTMSDSTFGSRATMDLSALAKSPKVRDGGDSPREPGGAGGSKRSIVSDGSLGIDKMLSATAKAVEE